MDRALTWGAAEDGMVLYRLQLVLMCRKLLSVLIGQEEGLEIEGLRKE